MPSNELTAIKTALHARFGEDIPVDLPLSGLDELARIAAHRTHRQFVSAPIKPDLLRLLCACALSAPSKSDLQQCDVIIVSDQTTRSSIGAKIPDMPWIEDAPAFLIFVGNGDRLPEIARLR